MPKKNAAPTQTQKKSGKAKAQPTPDEIALRAYHIYLERGCTPGDPMADWLRAEQELLAAPKKSSGKSKKVVSIAA